MADIGIHVTLDQAIASDQNPLGDHFEATVSEPVVIDGKTVIPQGAYVEGLVVDTQHSGGLKGRARLQLTRETVNVNGQNYDVRTSSSWRSGGAHKKRTWAWIGGGAGGGALIGGLDGGAKGALIGGPVVHLRAETPLTFKLAGPRRKPEHSLVRR